MALATQTRPPRIRMTAPARREHLLDVTTEIVVEQGFRGVSIEAVAQRAGITRAVVYRHFNDLPALLEAVVTREMSRALGQVSDTALSDLSTGDPIELMLESLRRYLEVVQQHPTTWRLVLTPPEGAPPSLRKSIERGRRLVLAQLAAAVRPALDAEAYPVDAELTARVLSAVSDEYARLVLSDPAQYSPDRVLDHAAWCLHRPSPS
jgi:AcrR family transcriptional regulator